MHAVAVAILSVCLSVCLSVWSTPKRFSLLKYVVHHIIGWYCKFEAIFRSPEFIGWLWMRKLNRQNFVKTDNLIWPIRRHSSETVLDRIQANRKSHTGFRSVLIGDLKSLSELERPNDSHYALVYTTRQLMLLISVHKTVFRNRCTRWIFSSFITVE